MNKGILRLAAVSLLACSSFAFAADEGVDMDQGSQSTSMTPSDSTQSVPVAGSTQQYTGEEIRSMEPRPKDLDLRYCLELKDTAAIAKCAGE